MGMYDNIRCEVPLPDGWIPDELQTKDFDCEMITHIISKDGRFLMDRGTWEEVPLENRPDPNFPASGSIRRVSKYEDANFHGVIHFYGTEPIERVPYTKYDPLGYRTTKWHAYDAKFTDGQLVSIEDVSGPGNE